MHFTTSNPSTSMPHQRQPQSQVANMQPWETALVAVLSPASLFILLGIVWFIIRHNPMREAVFSDLESGVALRPMNRRRP